MTSPALQIALAHHHAWTRRDLVTALTYLADDVVLDAPAGRLVGRAAYREFLDPFASRLLIRAELIAAFGDETTALLMYDTETIATRSAPAAECATVRDGKIVYNRFVFDRSPFTEFHRRQAGGGSPPTGGGAPEVGGGARPAGGGAPEVGGGTRAARGGAPEVGGGVRQADEGGRRAGDGVR